MTAPTTDYATKIAAYVSRLADSVVADLADDMSRTLNRVLTEAEVEALWSRRDFTAGAVGVIEDLLGRAVLDPARFAAALRAMR